MEVPLFILGNASKQKHKPSHQKAILGGKVKPDKTLDSFWLHLYVKHAGNDWLIKKHYITIPKQEKKLEKVLSKPNKKGDIEL
ncbi:MAG: hypothetical protein J7L96_10295 [Bacteroidales bacterium]|nr:hypothetical protein [Bacteroidales bacterium]